MAARKFNRAAGRPARNPVPEVSIPALELRFTLRRLRQCRAIVSTAVGALVHQNADADADIASVLQHSLGALLLAEITQLETRLGEEPG